MQLPVLVDESMRQRFIEIGALKVGGHFVYSGGGHCDEFFDFEAIVPRWPDIMFFYNNLCEGINDQRINTDVVIGPERGGIALAHMTSYFLEKTANRPCRGIYAEKIRDVEERRLIGCRYRIPAVFLNYLIDSTVLVLDDIANTGGNIAEVVSLVRQAGAKQIIVAIMINRCCLTADQVSADRLITVVEMPNKVWSAADCPMCKSHIPIDTEFGHGAEFLASQAGK